MTREHDADSGLVLTEEFRQALDWLEQGEHVFLTGKAGTGKSTLIREFLRRTTRKSVVAAPTGIAALNVGGYTIHRLFSFSPTTTLDEVADGRYYPAKFAETLRELDTLIIDEVSMVRADLFDQLAVALRRFGPRRGQPFGGVQLVLVGDLYQLPPVVAGEEEATFFRTRYESPYFFSADHYDRDAFRSVALTHVFRQSDSSLVDMLNAVRDGTIQQDTLDHLNRRLDPAFEPDLDEFWVTLTTTNKTAERRNRDRLNRLVGPDIVATAVVEGDLSTFDPPTAETLCFKVGAQIMLLTNDPSDRWFNGTIARIARWNAATGEVVVDLPDGSTATVAPHRWEVTRPTVHQGALVHEPIGAFTQLPFRLAWAITIHKSQGQTLDRMIVDLTGGTFTDGQLYVALSRCTSLDGLVLAREVKHRDLRIDPRVHRFLRSVKAPAPALPPAYLGVITVGDSGRSWRPRPIEIACVTDDGISISTIINPCHDLEDSRTRYGIGARDVQLAPTLVEAWAVISDLLNGRVLVGVDIDRDLGYIDYEIKRLARAIPPQLGGNVGDDHDADLVRTLPSAVQRARAVQALAASSQTCLQGGLPLERAAGLGAGYLLPRGDNPHQFMILPDAGPDARLATAQSMMSARDRSNLSREQDQILAAVCRQLGLDAEDPSLVGSDGPGIDEVLIPGATVCFSGTTVLPDGRRMQKEELAELARDHGLVVVDTVTKKACDCLVTAEPGSQSGKAKAARRWGKPVYNSEGFLAWASDRRGPQEGCSPHASPEAVVVEIRRERD